MQLDQFAKNVKQADLNTKGAIGDLDDVLHKIEFRKLNIDELSSLFSTDLLRFRLIIGLWAFDITRSPKFVDDKLIGYDGKLIDQSNQALISQGLVEVIKLCRVEDATDGDAIDYHYDACGRLYRLNKETAEQILVNELNQSKDTLISMRLMEALGVLVNH